MLKVMHFIIGLNIGGAELMLKRLVLYQKAHRDIDHIVVSLTDIGPVGVELMKQGVKVHSLGLKKTPVCIVSLWRMFILLRKESPDIIQTWMYHADLVAGTMARLCGFTNIIWGVRTTNVSEGKNRTTVLVRRLCAWMSGVVPKKIICAAHASLLYHVNIGYKKSKMLHIPNGYEVNKFFYDLKNRNELRGALGVSDDEILIGSLGRYSEVKDHDGFIKATKMILDVFPKVKIVLVGRGLDFNNMELIEKIESTGMSSRYILLGQRNDVERCMNAMDIFCLHSKNEGFPNVLVEAMLSGLPCVTTNVGDAALIAGDGGIVVNKGVPEELAEGLERLLKLDRFALREIGGQMRVRARSEFSLEKSSNEFRKVYFSLIKNL